MKKYMVGVLVSVALLVGLTSSQAQVPNRSYPFLADNVLSLTVTNTIPITNLFSTLSTTNLLNTSYTNTSGTLRVLTNSTQNLFQDVPLWSLRGGEGAWSTGTTNGSVLYTVSYGTLAVTMQSQSGADAAITFRMRPLYGNSKFSGRPNEATSTADEWIFSLTPTASSVQTFTTNAPLYKWPGATGLRLHSVTNTDVSASGAVFLRDVSLNGFVPVGQ